MIKDIPYIRSIMFVSSTAPARYERAGLLEKIRLSTGIVRGLSGYMQKHRDDSGASEQHRELMEYQRKQNAFRCDMALSELWRHYTAFLADGYAAEKTKAQAFLQARLNEQIAIHEKNIRNAKEWKEREIADWDRTAKYFQIDETHRDDPRWGSYYSHVDAKAVRRAEQRAVGIGQYDDLIATNEATIEKLRAGDHSLQVGADHLLTTLERVMGDARVTLAEYGGLDAGELDEAFAETERDAELHDMEAAPPVTEPALIGEAGPEAVIPLTPHRTEPKSDADPKRIPSPLIPSVWAPIAERWTGGVPVPVPEPEPEVIDFAGTEWYQKGSILWPSGIVDQRVENIWVRPNGTGKVRAFSDDDMTGLVVDFGDIEVVLESATRRRFYFANLTAAQVKEIRG